MAAGYARRGEPLTARATPRLRQLDILRGVAILLVLGRHMGYVPVWQRTGWLGVQLFFVLSGFLVAGLLFHEHRNSGRIELRRFYLRRGIKIYPLFALLLLATLAMQWLHHVPVPGRTVVAELFFLQNYLPPLWAHEWSLAVEEHFYLVLPLALLLLSRRSGERNDPYRLLPYWLGLLGAGVLALRLLTVSFHPFDRQADLYPTHLRIDTLAFGVLLAYFHHYRGAALAKFVRQNRGWLAAAACALLSPFLLFDLEQPAVRTLGFTTAYLGLGAVLLLAAHAQQAPASDRDAWLHWPGGALAWVGRCSYGIYLWHLPVRDWLVAKLAALGWLTHGTGAEFLLFVGLSLTSGSALTYLVEAPILRWRDRRFPGRGGSLTAALPAPESATAHSPAISPAH